MLRNVCSMSGFTKREDGVLNAFPIEVEEQVVETNGKGPQYAIAAGIALALVGGLCWVAFTVS